MKAFSFLEEGSLGRAALVDRTWLRLSASDVLWRPIYCAVFGDPPADQAPASFREALRERNRGSRMGTVVLITPTPDYRRNKAERTPDGADPACLCIGVGTTERHAHGFYDTALDFGGHRDLGYIVPYSDSLALGLQV